MNLQSRRMPSCGAFNDHACHVFSRDDEVSCGSKEFRLTTVVGISHMPTTKPRMSNVFIISASDEKSSPYQFTGQYVVASGQTSVLQRIRACCVLRPQLAMPISLLGRTEQ